jgi:hypothetical protein
MKYLLSALACLALVVFVNAQRPDHQSNEPGKGAPNPSGPVNRSAGRSKQDPPGAGKATPINSGKLNGSAGRSKQDPPGAGKATPINSGKLNGSAGGFKQDPPGAGKNRRPPNRPGPSHKGPDKWHPGPVPKQPKDVYRADTKRGRLIAPVGLGIDRKPDYHRKFGTAFPKGHPCGGRYFYKGWDHHQWTKWTFDRRYGCNLYWCPYAKGYYYWCAPDLCYYPVQYVPYKSYTANGDANDPQPPPPPDPNPPQPPPPPDPVKTDMDPDDAQPAPMPPDPKPDDTERGSHVVPHLVRDARLRPCLCRAAAQDASGPVGT